MEHQTFSEEQLGNPHSNVWVVSDTPKRGESAPMKQQNSVGFMGYLYGQDIDVTDVRFDYLVNEVPSRGGVETFWADGSLKKGAERLRERIQKYKPNLVILLGAEPLRAMFGRNGVLKWRGHVLMLGDVKCIVTFNPVDAHRQRFVDIKQKPGQYQVLMRQDIRKAVYESKFSEPKWDDIPCHICTNFADTVTRLQSMYENANIISFDIEVIEPYEGRLMDCLSLGDENKNFLCIPLWRSTGDPKDKKTWGVNRIWKSEVEFIVVFHWVKKVLESSIPKVAQNSQYDITSLEYYYNVEVNNLAWDTMVAAHTIFCDLPKDLGTLISMYTNIPYHKYLIHSGAISDRWEYSAADSGANLHIMAGQKKEMCELDGIKGSCPGGFEECLMCTRVYQSPLHKHYRMAILPNIRHIVDMHKNGVRVDVELRQLALDVEHSYQDAILFALSKAVPVHLGPAKQEFNVNPKSSDQMKKLFYDLLGCKKVYVKGKPKMNDHARSTIRKRDPRAYVHKLLDICEAYIYSDASLLKFKVPLDDGHIRTLYKPEGTDTGRFSSTASDVLPAGTNLQNIEKGLQRAAIIPESDEEEFLHADLYAAEAFLNFLDAGELDGLKMISGLLPEQEGKYEYTMLGDCRVMTTAVSDNLKIHNWLGKIIWDNFPEEAKAANLKYEDAKQLIHAMNYNAQPGVMSKESGLPVSVCQWVHNMYHTKFPGIHDRMVRIQDTIRRTKYLETPVGRRRYFFSPVNDKLLNVAYAWPSQSTIGEVDNMAMVSCCNWSGVNGRPLFLPVLNTHDGIVCRIKKGTRDEVIPYVLSAYRTKLRLQGLSITIPVSIGFGQNFNDNVDEKVYFYPVEV